MKTKLLQILAISLFISGVLIAQTPTDGSAGVSYDPYVSFSWSAYTFEDDATNEDDRYVLLFGTETGVLSLTTGNIDSNITSLNVAHPFEANKEYFWAVQVYDDGVLVNTYGEYSFKTKLAEVTGLTYVTEEDINVSTLMAEFTYDVGDTASAASILIRYRETGAVSWIDLINTSGVITSGTFTGEITSPPLTYNTEYEWEYTVTNEDEPSDVQSNSGILKTAFNEVYNISPVNNYNTYDRTPTLDWGIYGNLTNTNGVEYDIVYTYNGGGTQTITTAATADDTTYTFPSDLDPGVYTWYVVARDNAGDTYTNSPVNSSADTRTFEIFPGLISPVNGLTGVSIEPEFTWESLDMMNYTIEISKDPSFNTGVITKEITNGDTTYQFVETDTTLENNTLYYWRVGQGLSPSIYTPVWHFTTVPKVNVTIGYPTANLTITDLVPTLFSWALDQAVGNMKMNLQVKATSTEPTPTEWLTREFSDTTNQIVKSVTLNGGTNYYWRIVVLNSNNEVISYSTAVPFSTLGGISVPIPSYPIDGTDVYVNNPNFIWYISGTASFLTYDIEIDDDSTFASVDVLEENISALTWAPSSPLNPGTTYYWRIRSVYKRGTASADTSAYSEKEAFTTKGSGTVVVPTLSYPVDSLTVYTTAPFLFWFATNGGTGLVYDIQYDTTETFTGSPVVVENVSTLFYQASGLRPGATYYWRVRSDNGSAVSDWSSTEKFAVTGGITNAYPVASFPAGNGNTVYTTTPTLLWYLEGLNLGITKYTVRWKVGSVSSDWESDYDGTVDINDPNILSYTFASDLNEGSTYYWAVASHDGIEYSAWSGGSFLVYSNTVIAAPLLSYPVGNLLIYINSADLIWYQNGSASGIQGYEITYSKSDVWASSVTTVIPASSVPFNAYTITDLTPGATYYWRVRTWYGGSTYSGYSSTGTFVIDPGALSVQPLVGGPNNISVATSAPTLSWVLPAASSSDLKFDLEVSENSDFATSQKYEGLTSTAKQIDNLEDGKTYYWRVTSKTEGGDVSYYSNTGNFAVVQSVTDVKEPEITLPEHFSVKPNYPNPFNPSTTIQVDMPEDGNLKIEIFDMLGRKVTTLINHDFSAGNHRFIWDGRNSNNLRVTSGTYFYRVSNGENVVTMKMLLLK